MLRFFLKDLSTRTLISKKSTNKPYKRVFLAIQYSDSTCRWQDSSVIKHTTLKLKVKDSITPMSSWSRNPSSKNSVNMFKRWEATRPLSQYWLQQRHCVQVVIVTNKTFLQKVVVIRPIKTQWNQELCHLMMYWNIFIV